MYKLIRPVLFLFDPEKIHTIAFQIIKAICYFPGFKWLIRSSYRIKNRKLERELFGIKFDNPVGLAAGFDKDAYLVDELSSFGFGFVEIGTVTPLPQDGNSKPRLFRLKKDKALINRMGFNNSGVEEVASRLRNRKSDIIVGGNIGRNKITKNSNAIQDYEICFEKLFPYVDYFVINVSSPNTPGLRDLQEKKPLIQLLSRVQELNSEKENRKPVLLKIAPDLSFNQLDDIIQIIKQTGIDGVIATNTTISRDDLNTASEKITDIGSGGLSGNPLKYQSTRIIKYLSQKSNKSFAIIGVGGVDSVDSALEKLDAGADLIQLYTGFIYEGPILINKINKALIRR